MPTKKMRITIKHDGRTEIHVLAAEGPECLAFTNAVEDALGTVQTRELTAGQERWGQGAVGSVLAF